MKKIEVNKDLCIGCGACVAIDSEHFAFDEDGKSEVINNENVESENTTNAIDSEHFAFDEDDKSEVINNENVESENTTNAIESCPTSAISLVECEENCGCADGKECTCEEGNCHCQNCTCHENENAA